MSSLLYGQIPPSIDAYRNFTTLKQETDARIDALTQQHDELMAKLHNMQQGNVNNDIGIPRQGANQKANQQSSQDRANAEFMAKANQAFMQSPEGGRIEAALNHAYQTWMRNSERGQLYMKKMFELETQSRDEFIQHSPDGQKMKQQRDFLYSKFVETVWDRIAAYQQPREPILPPINADIEPMQRNSVANNNVQATGENI